MNNKQLIELYLMYWNEFLTVDAFAQYIQVSNLDALRIIRNGRKVFNAEGSK